MASWKIWLSLSLLLLLSISRIEAHKNEDDDTDIQALNLSNEEAEDYSHEHDENEIDLDEEHEESDVEMYTVCRKDKSDHCVCDKKLGRVDCRKETRGDKNKDSVEPLIDAAIKIEDENFRAKYVYLTANKIRYIDKETLMPSLAKTVEGIDFSFNQINYIDESSFDNFVKLRKLRFHQNFIQLNASTDGWLSEKLGKTLELLNLSYNMLEVIAPGTFDTLHSLRRLILDGNPALKLSDDTFGKRALQKLDTLSLDNCKLTDLPTMLFVNLPNLRHISLMKNPLTSVPSALNKVPKLLTLDLSRSDIDEWKENSLKDDSSVSAIYLREMTKLKKLGDCAFCGLTNLSAIDLSESKKLESIDENAFGFINNAADSPKGIKIFKVEGCAITTLAEKMLPWADLEQISIAGNPLNCDDKLKWIINNKDLHAFTGKDVPKCASPADKKDVPLFKIASDSTASSGGGGFFRAIFYMGATVALVGSILVGVLYVNRRYGGSLFARQPTSGVGFSNLNAQVDLEDEGGLVHDDDGEFAPRPEAV